MKRIIKIVIYICISFLIIYNVVLTIQKIVEPNKIPNFWGYKNFVIFSGSMENTLNIGDIIFVKAKSEIKKNDIISFRENNSIITHRVIEKFEKNGEVFYKTKGDANTAIDTKLVSEEEIEGVYCFKIAKIGTIIMFLQSKVGIAILIIVLLMAYIFTNRTAKQHIKKGKHSI